MSDISSPKDPRKSKRSGSFLLGNTFILVATIFFGVNVPISKWLMPTWLTSEDITVLRIVVGAAILWLVSLAMKTDKIERKDYLKTFLGGALGLFGFLYLFNMALKYGDPIDISIIMTFPPVFVIVIGIIFQHHRASLLEILGVLVGLIGAAVVIIGGGSGEKGSDNLLGDILALASTICYAFYLVILEGPTHKYRPVSLLRWVFLAASLPAIFFAWHLPEAAIWHTTDVRPWLSLGFVLIFVTVVSYFLINPAIKMIGSELTSMYQYLLPVFATIASVMIGLARLHLIQVVAMVIIIVGMVLTNIAKKKSRTATDVNNGAQTGVRKA